MGREQAQRLGAGTEDERPETVSCPAAALRLGGLAPEDVWGEPPGTRAWERGPRPPRGCRTLCPP